mgnify:CR=1 FL=1
MMSFIPPIDKKEVDFDTLSSIPISPWHISSQLCEAIYLYSLKNKDPECYFKDDNSLLSRIRADVFFKVFEEISCGIYTELDQLDKIPVDNQGRKVVVRSGHSSGFSIRCPKRRLLLSHDYLYATISMKLLEKLFVKYSLETWRKTSRSTKRVTRKYWVEWFQKESLECFKSLLSGYITDYLSMCDRSDMKYFSKLNLLPVNSSGLQRNREGLEDEEYKTREFHKFLSQNLLYNY